MSIVQRQIDRNREMARMNLDTLEYKLCVIHCSPMSDSQASYLWELDQWWMREYAHRVIGPRRDTIEAAFTMCHIKRREWARIEERRPRRPA